MDVRWGHWVVSKDILLKIFGGEDVLRILSTDAHDVEVGLGERLLNLGYDLGGRHLN